MIEINLLPGGQKRKKRKKAGGGFSLKLPETMPSLDRMTLFIIVAWIVGPAAIGWMYFDIQGDMTTTDIEIEQAVADSTRFASIIETQRSLQARQDTIAQKLQIIQQIDQNRYMWAHILDEVSRSLPAYTWLERLEQNTPGPPPDFFVEGKAGELPAVTRFAQSLEASPFIRNVVITASEQVMLDNNPNRLAYNFVLRATYEQPPLEAIETVPLFEGEDSMTAAVAGTTGGANGATP